MAILSRLRVVFLLEDYGFLVTVEFPKNGNGLILDILVHEFCCSLIRSVIVGGREKNQRCKYGGV